MSEEIVERFWRLRSWISVNYLMTPLLNKPDGDLPFGWDFVKEKVFKVIPYP